MSELQTEPTLNSSSKFNVKLGKVLFSDPQRDRSNAIVVSNSSDPSHGIEAGGLIKIDFTVNKINYDRLFIVTLNDNWIGYRRFQFMPVLNILTDDGGLEITPEIQKTIKVVGLVTEIYKKV